jgi:hypothetical protein
MAFEENRKIILEGHSMLIDQVWSKQHPENKKLRIGKHASVKVTTHEGLGEFAIKPQMLAGFFLSLHVLCSRSDVPKKLFKAPKKN